MIPTGITGGDQARGIVWVLRMKKRPRTLGSRARIVIHERPEKANAPMKTPARPAAVAALGDRCFVAVTVVLEFEWVMRGFYGLSVADVSRVLRALAGLAHVTLEDRDAVLAALDAFDQGLDFADALHLARSARASGFATFDQRLAKRAAEAATAQPTEQDARIAELMAQNEVLRQQAQTQQPVPAAVPAQPSLQDDLPF